MATEEAAAPKTLGNVETKEPEFRELTRLQAFDRQMHIQKSIEMGMSREEAERHADHDLKDRDDSRP
jgi:hypothetical protein